MGNMTSGCDFTCCIQLQTLELRGLQAQKLSAQLMEDWQELDETAPHRERKLNCEVKLRQGQYVMQDNLGCNRVSVRHTRGSK